jgi:hypothetical protein
MLAGKCGCFARKVASDMQVQAKASASHLIVISERIGSVLPRKSSGCDASPSGQPSQSHGQRHMGTNAPSEERSLGRLRRQDWPGHLPSRIDWNGKGPPNRDFPRLGAGVGPRRQTVDGGVRMFVDDLA